MQKRRTKLAPHPTLKTTGNSTNVVVNIQPGPASPAQRQAWKRFWQKLIAEVKAEEKESPPSQALTKDALTGGDKESYSHE